MTTSRVDYVLGSEPSEQERLRQLSDLYAQLAKSLLDAAGVNEGARGIDIGCGPRGILDLLVDQVGPNGTVMGLDQDSRQLEAAHEFMTRRAATNISFVHADARSTGLPSNSFDFTHARLVLAAVSYPEDVIAEMLRITRPGGVVAIEDIDNCSWVCEPPHSAWDRLFEGMRSIWSGDWYEGRHAPTKLRAAGLADLHVSVHLPPMTRAGHPDQYRMLTLAHSVRGKLVERGVFTEPELDDLIGSLQSHLDTPTTFTTPALIYQVWGCKSVE